MFFKRLFHKREQNIWTLKKEIIIGLILVVAVAAIVTIIAVPFKQKPKTAKEIEAEIFFKGKPVATAQLGQTVKFGPLEITCRDMKESSYLSLDLDENYQRIVRKYMQIHAKVQNTTYSPGSTINLIIGLLDDRKGQYRLDHSVPFYVPGLKDFGQNMTIWPSIIQEGELFFLDVNPEAQKFQLIFANAETKEKIIFKFSR